MAVKRSTDTVDAPEHTAPPSETIVDKLKAPFKRSADPVIYERIGGANFEISLPDKGTAKGRRLVFEKTKLELGAGWPIHQLNVDSPSVQRDSGLTREEIIEAVENEPEFKKHSVGVVGIWRKDERLTEEQRASKHALAADIYNELPDTALKATLESRNVAIPTNATHDELVELCRGSKK